MVVYHGSDHIIEHPRYHFGKKDNDYGYGFYTKEDKELTKEWACAVDRDGFANSYELDLNGLNILHLNAPEYNVLNWLAVLNEYRNLSIKGALSEQAKDYIRQHFFVDTSPYDIIIGHRADDSYFMFARDFLAGTTSVRKLTEAMFLGGLGEQIVLKSEAAFDRIHFIGYEVAKAKVYYAKRAIRDRKARQFYRSNRYAKNLDNEIFILDIIREGITNDDPRLRQGLR